MNSQKIRNLISDRAHQGQPRRPITITEPLRNQLLVSSFCACTPFTDGPLRVLTAEVPVNDQASLRFAFVLDDEDRLLAGRVSSTGRFRTTWTPDWMIEQLSLPKKFSDWDLLVRHAVRRQAVITSGALTQQQADELLRAQMTKRELQALMIAQAEPPLTVRAVYERVGAKGQDPVANLLQYGLARLQHPAGTAEQDGCLISTADGTRILNSP